MTKTIRVQQMNCSDAGDRKRFWNVGAAIYAGDDRWVPALHSDQRLMMDKERHPFYRHSKAAFFIVEEDGTAIGRVAILNNRSYREFHQNNTGFFTQFECRDDEEAAQRLFDAASQWARQEGLDSLIGPRGFVQGEGAGILVDGFEERLPMGLNYNPPYYDRLLNAIGFSKMTDYHSGLVEGDYQFPERVQSIAERIRRRNGYRVHVLRSKAEMRALIPHVHRIYNEAFTAVPGYYPMTEEEIALMSERIMTLTEPELIKLVYKDDVIIGFMIAYPNIRPALQAVRGRMLPFGWLRLLAAKRTSTWLDFNGVGILPRYQGTGANAVLYDEMWRTLHNERYDHGMAVQVREENDRSLADIHTLGAVDSIVHRLYSIQLP